MTAREFIQNMENDGFKFKVYKGCSLVVEPASRLTGEMRAFIKAHKQKMI